MPAEKGVSLLEMMVVLALASTLSMALLLMARSVQIWSIHLNALLERDEDAELAPLILLRAVTQVGNNQALFSASPVDLTADLLSLRSDFDGSGHFPDGALRSPFESVQFRCRDGHFQMRSGSGSFQSILKNTPQAGWSWNGSTSLNIQITSSVPLVTLPEEAERELTMRFFLWNFRPHLFGAGP